MANEPTLSITLNDYDKLRSGKEAAEVRVGQLMAELDAAKLQTAVGTSTDTGVTFLTAFKAAFEIVQFAVGNLDPSTVRRWPVDAVRQVADAIDALPGLDIYTRETPMALRDFAKLAAGYEEVRRVRDANRVAVPATAADFGPQTPEALAIHQFRAGTLNSQENGVSQAGNGDKP